MSDAQGPLSAFIICFSGFRNDDDDCDIGEITERTNGPENICEKRDISLGTLTRLATSLGAVVHREVITQTSILIAREGLTRKRIVAERFGIPVVSLKWLQLQGRVSLSAVRVPPLQGYVFCSTQLNAEEEASLAKIITHNGGKFDRTLNAQTSMLFIPGGWLKKWKKQQLKGRASTDSFANATTAARVELSEKIRFAWNIDIPVVEYPRFVAMASLRVNGIGSGDESVWVDGNAPRADFDTIAELCAVPSSVACGIVPPSQSHSTHPLHSSKVEEESEEKNLNTVDENDVGPEGASKEVKKRTREMCSIQDMNHDANGDESEMKRYCSEKSGDDVVAIKDEENSANNISVPFFSHSNPFLQVTLIGCNAREMLESVRMSVACRFLRTPVPTHVTDVVVVGSELDAQQLAQLRDQLALTCGVPLRRIVTIQWLEACYNCMLCLQDAGKTFCPAPLPLDLIPPTEAHCIRIPSSANSLFDVQQPQKQTKDSNEKEEDEEGQPRVSASSPQSNSRNSTTLGSRQSLKLFSAREPRVSMGDASRASGPLNDEIQRRYDADVRLAKRRVEALFHILDPLNATSSSVMIGEPLASGLFCFVDGEFSRVELAVVRALAKHGRGTCLKRTRDEWRQVIKGAVISHPGESDDAASAATLARRSSVRRLRFLRDGSASADTTARESASQSLSKRSGPQLALRVIPHGDQRPAEHFLRQPPPRLQQRRDPLRYLPAVTQDYILSSLAAGKLLDPRGCFLFTRATPVEAERGARCRSRAAAGRPLRVSSWSTSRQPEKAPVVGVSVFFLCTEHANGAGLQGVLRWSLGAAVMELGGSVAETLRDDVVTHVVVVDVAGMLNAQAFDAQAAVTLPQQSHVASHMSGMENSDSAIGSNNNEDEREEALCEALLAARTGPVPLSSDIQSNLPPRYLHDARAWASAGRLTIVGLDWLEACVMWGVFLDEAPFALIPAREEILTRAVSIPRAFTTPPPTPGQHGTADATLLPLNSTGMSAGRSPRVATHFDFTTPVSTPSRARALQESRPTSVMRQSCPRSTLRTPQRHCVSVPRAISPALGVPHHTGSPPHEKSNTSAKDSDIVQSAMYKTALNTPIASSSSSSLASSMDLEERVATSGSPTQDGGGACTPIRSSRVLGDSADRSLMDRRSTAGRLTAPPASMPQWDPSGGINSNNNNSNNNNSVISIDARPSTHMIQQPDFSQKFLGRDDRGQFELVALRIHIVGDVPEREWLVRACARLSESANNSLAGGNFGDDQIGTMPSGQNQKQEHQLLLRRMTTASMAAGFSRVDFMTPAVRNADVVVTHELTQRESILAAIAAGLWVITPKALQDCCSRECLLPLRDLAMYEWCPELLPRNTPDRILQLAKQCGHRRKQRQATGRRLFDGQCFLLISANAGAARVQSLQTVVETGGGNVVSVVVLRNDKCPSDNVNANNDSNNSIRSERDVLQGHPFLGSFFSDVRVLASTEAVMHFIVSLIEGSESNSGGADDASSDRGINTLHCGGAASKAKELFVLFDDDFFMDETNSVPLREMSESLQKGKSQLRQAKRQSLEKQQERRRNFPQWHMTSFDDGEDAGMPQLEILRLFTSEWLTLTIQQRQKAPECVVELN